MRELMEEEELFCLEEENNTTNNYDHYDHDASQGRRRRRASGSGRHVGGGCRGGVKKRKDHVLVEGKNENARNASSFKRAKSYQRRSRGRRRRFRSRRQNPGHCLLQRSEQVAALTKWPIRKIRHSLRTKPIGTVFVATDWYLLSI